MSSRVHFANVPGREFKVTAAIRGKPDLAASATVHVPESGRVADVELVLDFGAPIRGVVVKPDGTPALGMLSGVLAGNQPARVNAVSGAGGRFELLGNSEELGEVVLVTKLASYNWTNPDARLGASPPVVARPGETRFTLTLRDLVVLNGRVEDAAGQPVAGMFVSAFPSGSLPTAEARLASVVTDEFGSFSMELPSGGRVDLETGTLQRDRGSDPIVSAEVAPVRLESVASDARDVVVQLVD